MTCSRRDLALLLPAVATAQEKPQKPMLPSKSFKYEDLPVKENAIVRSRLQPHTLLQHRFLKG